VAFASIVAVATFSIAPKQNTSAVAVIFSPWTDAAEAMSRSVESGGRFVRFGAFDFIAIVEPESGEYARRVRDAGAWLLADPVTLAACLRPFSPKKT
jgi:hypothetical protein